MAMGPLELTHFGVFKVMTKLKIIVQDFWLITWLI